MRDARLFRLVTLLLFGTAAASSQSLGDVARQERQRQASNPPSNRHVITNDDLRAGSPGEGTTAIAENSADPFAPRASYDPNSSAARELQAKIKDQKEKVENLEKSIQELQAKLDARDSVGSVSVYERVVGGVTFSSPPPAGTCATYASTGGYNPYQEWCDQPKKWQAEIEAKQTQLDTEHGQLEALQEYARKLGFSSKFYDPD
jgi:hypothetical protein